MKTHINYFFSDSTDYDFPNQVLKELGEEQVNYDELSKLEKSQLKELIDYFNSIKNDKLKQNILDLVKSLENIKN